MSVIQLLQWPGFSKIFIYFSCFLILFQDFSKLIIDIVLYLVRHISNIKKKKKLKDIQVKIYIHRHK